MGQRRAIKVEKDNNFGTDLNTIEGDINIIQDMATMTEGDALLIAYRQGFSPGFGQLYVATDNIPGATEATAEEHNIAVDNPSTASKEEEKVQPISLGERKNYPFKGFNISDEAPKKLTQLINDYSEWIADGLLKHHVGRYCQQQAEVSQNEECLIDIIKGFSISVGLPWHLIDKVYIPINCGDEFHWVLAVFVLKERRIRVYDSMS
ncbi:hypothetical protein CQW23_14131 [Capsicum baccatum]|uniref:Ubiquitin-like protease family profile domain-containing protein n=1 Tax=Capsicum baccatum TaxID=33114 RepID=A0A2G2WIB8_CAPBA|nr:hypothetical protein CQW23_14131 [Capsicum baccatum]